MLSGSLTRTPTVSSSRTVLADPSDEGHKNEKASRKSRQGGATNNAEVPPRGISITRLRSLEPITSPAAPLARILSGPRNESSYQPKVPNPYPGKGTVDDPYLVDWLIGESANPYNWGNAYRWTVTAVVAMATLCISFASSAYSAAIADIESHFHVSSTVAVLGLSLYVVGTSRRQRSH